MEQTLKGHIRKRTLLYWGYNVDRMFLIIVVMSGAYGLLGARLEIGGAENRLFSALWYLLLMGTIMILIMPMSYASSNVPMIISMGAGRKETLRGMQFANILFFIQMTLVFGIGGIVTLRTQVDAGSIEREMVIWFMMVGASLLFAAAALGQMGAWFQLRFGTRGSVIYTVIFMVTMLVTGVATGIFVGVNMGNEKNLLAAWDSIQSGMGIASVVVLIVGTVIYAVGYHLLKKVIMNYEVRR